MRRKILVSDQSDLLSSLSLVVLQEQPVLLDHWPHINLLGLLLLGVGGAMLLG